uniref:Uncharacterized protein n=1 Tax=Oryza punctata TaxID=4537 RepID=A0A0E0M7J5_ORYPU
MESSRNGDVTVTYEQALFGRRRNGGGGGGFATYLDLVREEGDAGQMPPRQHGAASRRRTYADGELDVFAAERYFKGAMDGADDYKVGVAPMTLVVPEEMAAVAAAAARPAVAVSRPAWTTRASVASAGSASTANSQTVLLREQRRRDKCCVHVGGILRSCSGKRSVHVGGGTVTTEPSPAPASRIEWYRDLRLDKAGRVGQLAGDGVSHGGVVAAGLPPNLNNIGAARVAAIGREEATAATATEYSSSSFRSNFTLLAPVKVTVPASGGGGGDDDDDDVGSESSSDLFEIKSLMIDDCRYEPSEASVQWSVVTASAADVSVASERGGVGKGRPPPAVAVRQQQQQHRRQADRPVGLLAGCVNHRAVDVSAIAAVRRPPPPVNVANIADPEVFPSAGTKDLFDD